MQAKKSLDEMEDMVASLRSGWIAQDDGVVTAVNIKAGETYQGRGVRPPPPIPLTSLPSYRRYPAARISIA